MNKDALNKYGYKETSDRIKIDEARSFKKQKGKGYNYTNNISKELINNIKQLVKNLSNNKQITKQIYNNLIKAITYKNDS